MANPGWYISDPDDLIVFPVSPLWTSADELGGAAQKYEYYITNETIRGVEYSNKMFDRERPSYIFRVGFDDLITYFRAFHDAVLQNPFYYVFDTDDMSAVLFCKKDENFLPKKVGAGMWNGTFQGIYDLEIELRAQVAAAQILA